MSVDNQEPVWKRAHLELTRIAKARALLEHEEAQWLLVAYRERTHAFLGYGSFTEYAERVCGYTPRQSIERVRVARALEGLPMMRQTLREGELSWSAVRELSRVANSDTERRWIEAARHQTVRQVEKLVATANPGDLPDETRQEEVERHVLRIEVSAETYATYREAIAHLQREAGAGLDEEAALLAMSRQVLGGNRDSGRASYQIAMTVCPECGRGHQQGRGESVPVGAEIVEMAECDAQRLPEPHVGTSRATQDIPPATRRAVIRRDEGRCVVPGCRHATFLDIHHIELRSEGGTCDPDFQVSVCGAHHRALHNGTLLIEGSVSGGLRFSHADGTEYGGPVRADLAAARAEVFLALRSFGFKESESKRALARVPDQTTDVPTLFRDAMRVLRPRGVREPRVTYNAVAA